MTQEVARELPPLRFQRLSSAAYQAAAHAVASGGRATSIRRLCAALRPVSSARAEPDPWSRPRPAQKALAQRTSGGDPGTTGLMGVKTTYIRVLANETTSDRNRCRGP
jgi:hypothetical protein